MEPFTDDGDSAFLDVAANTLAIIIIVTVFSLAVAQEVAPTLLEPEAVLDPPLAFRPGERTPFPPPSRFVVFVESRAFVIDGDALHAQLLQSSPGPIVREATPQGYVDFIPMPKNAYDVDVYQFSFTPAPAYIAGLPPFAAEGAEAFVDALEASYRADGHAPTFLVYPSGMDTFAVAHDVLAPTTMPWRWTLVPEGQPVRIERSVRGFLSFTTYW